MGEVVSGWNGDGACIGYGLPFASLNRVHKVNPLKSVNWIWVLVLVYTLPFVAPGLLVSAITLRFAWRRGPMHEADQLSCALGSALGVLIWITCVRSVFSYDYILGLLFTGATPIAAAPALLLYGPGTRAGK